MDTSAVSGDISVQVSLTGTTEDELLVGDEVTDFSVLFEKMLSTNDENFPVIMEFLRINNFVPNPISEVYRDMGFTFINSSCNICDFHTRWKLAMNLKYLKENGCDLNLEMFNYLRSLTFGGNRVKRSENFLQIIHFLLPFCTDFFVDLQCWKKIAYICQDTKEIVEALRFLIINYGTEKHYKYLPQLPRYDPFSLKHLARNNVRESVWKDRKVNQTRYTYCEENLPKLLFKYLNFID